MCSMHALETKTYSQLIHSELGFALLVSRYRFLFGERCTSNFPYKFPCWACLMREEYLVSILP